MAGERDSPLPPSTPLPPPPGAGDGTITRQVNLFGRGSPERDEFQAIYLQLKRIARRELARGRPPGDLDTTVIVHDAILKLHNGHPPTWENRAHYFGAAANAMRRLLVDAARKRGRLERYARRTAPNRDHDAPPPGAAADVDLVALDEALDALAATDPALAQTVVLRYFGGLTVEQTADVMGICERTVKRNWSIARAWLFDRLARAARNGPDRPADPGP
jgi:RNA polymerase sigma factor (TIGR02999 family)